MCKQHASADGLARLMHEAVGYNYMKEKVEKLFSKEELDEIEAEANLNLAEYLDTIVISGESTEKSIITISKNNRLIFVEGNNDTGYKHLKDRHSPFSFKNYWVTKDNDRIKLDSPSKFNPRMMPILDFVKVADTIFESENKNITKNHKPDLFDKYTGLYTFSPDDSEKYHLITYKDTRVVHTLFPDKKKHNKKVKCNYGKGIVTTTLKFPDGLNDLIVPYENNKGVIAYSILIRKYYSEKTERLFIQKHNEDGDVEELFLLGFRHFTDFERFDREIMHQYQYGDLSELEVVINQIDKEVKNNCS